MSDGRAQTGTGEVVFSKDGKTHSIEGKLKLGGEDLAPLNDVYKPLNNP